MRRLDWQALPDFTIHIQGGTIDLLKVTPARMRQLAVDALQNSRLRAIAMRLEDQPTNHPVSLECVPATGRLAGIARALFTGAVWTRDRWVSCGYIMDPSCPCAGKSATLFYTASGTAGRPEHPG